MEKKTNAIRAFKILAVLGALSFLLVSCNRCCELFGPAICRYCINTNCEPRVIGPTVEELRIGYEAALDRLGVRVIKVGEIRKIVIPTDSIFTPGSANLVTRPSEILDVAAKYISTYDTISIQVSGHHENTPAVMHDQALTERQAQVVESYLWRRGINSRLMYALGFGNITPVAIQDSRGIETVGPLNCKGDSCESTKPPPVPDYILEEQKIDSYQFYNRHLQIEFWIYPRHKTFY